MITSARSNCKFYNEESPLITFVESQFSGIILLLAFDDVHFIVLSSHLPSDWDVVFSQAFVHLNEDDDATLQELLRLSANGALYVSTTIHDRPSEGMEGMHWS
jgi:hypothetical protein